MAEVRTVQTEVNQGRDIEGLRVKERPPAPCLRCGIDVEQKKSRRKKYCSPECQRKSHSENMKGKSNPNFNPSKDYVYSCETCGEEFKSYSATARFCSKSCNGKRQDNVRRLRVLAPVVALLPRKKRKLIGRKCKCKACGVVFRSPMKTFYCIQHKGYTNGKPAAKKEAFCVVCNKPFVRKYVVNQRKTCSSKCRKTLMSRIQRGSKSHRWEGGKTSKAMTIRNSAKYKRWRSSVFARDNYTCVKCGASKVELNADHIKPFSTHPGLRLDVSNGRTLCVPCHRNTKTFGAKAKYA